MPTKPSTRWLRKLPAIHLHAGACKGVYRQLQMPVSDAYEYAGELVVRNMAHTDAGRYCCIR
jgi:hypothetical protein